MELPPILLVPVVTELEWQIEPMIAEWTEVAAFDAPGVGAEPPAEERTRRAIADRGIQEIERRGWERCVVAGDEFGSVTAALLAALVPERVAGLALGHASLSLDTQGPRPALMEEVLETFGSMIRTSYRAYARALSQLTKGSYDDDFVERYIEQVPQPLMAEYEAHIQAMSPKSASSTRSPSSTCRSCSRSTKIACCGQPRASRTSGPAFPPPGPASAPRSRASARCSPVPSATCASRSRRTRHPLALLLLSA